MKQNTNISLNSISKQLNQNIEIAAAAATSTTTAAVIPPPPPICTHLNISTQTKVLFLNKTIDVENIYWKIPVMEYWIPKCGVLKKTVKLVCLTREKVTEIEQKFASLEEEGVSFKVDIIKQIDVATSSRTRFKDERKIIIGICKKDIMACRPKKKNVFYNCFSLVIRIGGAEGAPFHEIHVKIFNTGKMEIPGILNDKIFEQSAELILDILRPLLGDDCGYNRGAARGASHSNTPSRGVTPPNPPSTTRDDNSLQNTQLTLLTTQVVDGGLGGLAPLQGILVLINSNFNMGFYIHREKLHNILRGEKYCLNSSYDPCTYPGVKCKFYFNYEIGFNKEYQRGFITEKNVKMKTILAEKKYAEISIMIFRTGSGLIVGNCSREILDFIFEFFVTILHTEYYNIYAVSPPGAAAALAAAAAAAKLPKIRKKTIMQTPIGLFTER
jgi:hypothetical protein